MVQIRQLQQKAPGTFKFWRRVKVRIRRRRPGLKESSFRENSGRKTANFEGFDSDDDENEDQFDFQTERTKPGILGLSPCWGVAGTGRLLRLLSRKFSFRESAGVNWTVNAREVEKPGTVVRKEQVCPDRPVNSFLKRSRTWRMENERGEETITNWMNGRATKSLRALLMGDSEDGYSLGTTPEKKREERVVGEGCYGCTAGRGWLSRLNSRKDTEEMGDSERRKREQSAQASPSVEDPAALPDDIMEMCLARTPFASLMRARAVCKKWKSLTSSPHFLYLRQNIRTSDPWLFLFGLSRNGVCLGQIQALDPDSSKWHTINASILSGRVSYSVTAVNSVIYIIGGCSSSLQTSSGRSDKDSLKTLRTVLRYTPVTGSWKKVCPLTTERSAPIVGVFKMRQRKTSWREGIYRNSARTTRSVETSPNRRHLCGRSYRRGAGELAVYGGAETQEREPNSVGRTGSTAAMQILADLRQCSQKESYLRVLEAEFKRLSTHGSHSVAKEQRSFGLIVVGGQGTWNEQLDSAEIYDPETDSWSEIASLPADHGTPCAGVVCKNSFYVYSESNKLAAYDFERDAWQSIRVSQAPARLLDYTPRLVSCKDRIFLLGVDWAMTADGGSEMATRKIWELRQEPAAAGWVTVSQHPDAPLDWNAAFVADDERIFGVEMFKIFGQMLDFVTVCKISGSGGMVWERVSIMEMNMHEMDPSSCLTKTALVVQL